MGHLCLGFLFRDSVLNVGREHRVPTATQTPLRAQCVEVPAGVPEQLGGVPAARLPGRRQDSWSHVVWNKLL